MPHCPSRGKIAPYIIILPGSSFGWMTSCSTSYFNPFNTYKYISKYEYKYIFRYKCKHSKHYYSTRMQFWVDYFLLTLLFQPLYTHTDTNTNTKKEKNIKIQMKKHIYIIIIRPGSSCWATSCSPFYINPEITNSSIDTHRWFVEVQELIQTINGLWRSRFQKQLINVSAFIDNVMTPCDLSFIVNFSKRNLLAS